jgi:hypothetical protein
MASRGVVKAVLAQKYEIQMRTEKLAQCRWWLPFGLGCLLVGGVAHAQGTFEPIVMRTGSGNVLLTDTVAYSSLPSLPATSLLTIRAGFATQEQAQPGFFADSFTISISGPGGTAYLVTADVHGWTWAPSVPGSVPVESAAIQRLPITFGVPSEGLPAFTAYQLTFPLPESWRGVALSIDFDLFDNQDPQRSLGYYDVIPVPEPNSGAILLAGLLVWQWSRRKSVNR